MNKSTDWLDDDDDDNDDDLDLGKPSQTSVPNTTSKPLDPPAYSTATVAKTDVVIDIKSSNPAPPDVLSKKSTADPTKRAFKLRMSNDGDDSDDDAKGGKSASGKLKKNKVRFVDEQPQPQPQPMPQPQQQRGRSAVSVSIPDDEAHTAEELEERAANQSLSSLRTTSLLSMSSVLISAILDCVALFAVSTRSWTLLLLLVVVCTGLTGLACLFCFYHAALQQVIRLPLPEETNPKVFQKMSNKFMHIVMACLIVVLVEFFAFYQTLIVIVFQLKSNTDCADGVFSAWPGLSSSGQGIYICLFLNLAYSMACFVPTIRHAYNMHRFYLRQTYLHGGGELQLVKRSSGGVA